MTIEKNGKTYLTELDSIESITSIFSGANWWEREIYDFFEWNYDDKITHIRKIPVFRINPNDFLKIKNSSFRINNDFKEKIHNKTECFNQRKVTTIEYACLFTNAIEVVAILFDKEGNSNKYSNLFIDENTEVIEVCEQLEEEWFSYIVVYSKVETR